MASRAQTVETSLKSKDFLGAFELLGGRKVLRVNPKSRLEAHEMIVQGLPAQALRHLLERLQVLQMDLSLEKAVGMSKRTFQRRKVAHSAPLSQEQSGRTWKFAEILAKATLIFGSQIEAEQWLERPAIGLDHRRPIDLLVTPAGVELVEDHLNRLEFGVYA
jgi:putative toxin-antitoxin system antitoxin component (TIGR02293 family)